MYLFKEQLELSLEMDQSRNADNLFSKHMTY